jgi:hypothetical protein
MNDNLITQLAELAKACQRKSIMPIICGGLGIYLSFYNKEDEIGQMVRATQDIDLLLCRQDLLEKAKRKAIAEIITEELKYIVQPEKKYHGFKKGGTQELDILVPTVEDLPSDNYRLKIVKSTLHGHITEEAEFIEEGLRIIRLSDISKDYLGSNDVELYVPSPTNLMIMKLFAYNDRHHGNRKDPDRAMAHAWDVYIAIMLTDRTDFKEGQAFLSQHADSEIIKKARTIVGKSFSQYENAGWQTVLSSTNFHPSLSVTNKENKLGQAAARLRRWFGI